MTFCEGKYINWQNVSRWIIICQNGNKF
jgi:hypothetical protein